MRQPVEVLLPDAEGAQSARHPDVAGQSLHPVRHRERWYNTDRLWHGEMEVACRD